MTKSTNEWPSPTYVNCTKLSGIGTAKHIHRLIGLTHGQKFQGDYQIEIREGESALSIKAKSDLITKELVLNDDAKIVLKTTYLSLGGKISIVTLSAEGKVQEFCQKYSELKGPSGPIIEIPHATVTSDNWWRNSLKRTAADLMLVIVPFLDGPTKPEKMPVVDIEAIRNG
ncbi:MAG: hypothetical protein WCD70_04570 [Alphaproteobacteria bacterium]